MPFNLKKFTFTNEGTLQFSQTLYTHLVFKLGCVECECAVGNQVVC